MKPYGREKKVEGSGGWKKDYHLHDRNHRKIESWWEGICDYVSRARMKQDIKKEIKKEIEEDNGQGKESQDY